MRPYLRFNTSCQAFLLYLLILMGFSSYGFAQELRWKQFHNDRFGYDLSLPAAYLTVGPDELSRDGLTLRSIDGRVLIHVFGARNTVGSLDEVIAQVKRRIPRARVTYEWRRGHAAVLSGYQDDDIFYARIALSKDNARAAILAMSYPAAMKADLDPIVSRVSRSLTIN